MLGENMTVDSDWAGLPYHLLDLILEKIVSFKDILQFYCVCVSWHSVVEHNKDKCLMKSSRQVPILIFPNKKQHIWDMYDPMSDKVIESKLVIPYGKRFGGSSEGWLLAVNKDFSVTLYKPYSVDIENATIHLPCLFPLKVEDINPDFLEEAMEEYDRHIYKATITADPITNPNDCMVVVLFLRSRDMAFIRPMRDQVWTKIDPNEWGFSDILFYNSKFYVLQIHDRLLSYDLDGTKSVLIDFKEEELRWSQIKSYIVRSYDGDILQVVRQYDWSDDLKVRVTIKVAVFKLDFIDGGASWVTVQNLGDVALFLGDNSSIYVCASDFVGCKSNCIYFSHDSDPISHGPTGAPYDCGVYNLEDNSYTQFTFVDIEDSTMIDRFEAQPPIWIQPTLNL